MRNDTSAFEDRPPEAPGSAGPRGGCVRFAEFEFDFARDRLRRDGVVIPLSPKPAALLRYLLANPGRLLSKNELMRQLWAHVVVTDDSLIQCVSELRSRMGDAGPRLIATVPRRGYIFEAELRPVVPVDSAPAPLATAAAKAFTAPVADSEALAVADADADVGAARRRGWRGIAWVALPLFVALAGGAAYMKASAPPFRIDDELARRHSLVVTPFKDIGPSPAPMAVREGLVDEIAAQFSERQNGRVVRSTSAAGAPYAMSGSTTALGARLLVDLQVVSVPDGVVIWSERYDYPDGSDPGINADVAARATSGLRLRHAELHRAKVSAPGYRFDPADLTISGWEDIERRQTAEDVARGKARLREALKADPESVTALTGLGAALMSERYGYSGEPNPQDSSESERVAAKALDLAPNSSVALILWANVLLFRGEPALALPFYEKAMLRAPSNANAHLRYAYALMVLGRGDEMQTHIDEALRLGHRDPRTQVSAYSLASSQAFVAEDDAKAYALAQRALAERPTFGLSWAMLASIDALRGRSAAAARNMAEHRRLMPFNSIERYVINNPSGSDLYLASQKRMVEGLRAAGLPER